MQIKFRIPEILFGALLAIAVFAMGAMFQSSHGPASRDDPQNTTSQNSRQEKGETGRDKLTDWLLVAFNLGLFVSTVLLWRATRRTAKIAEDAVKVSQGIGQAQVRSYVSIKSAQIYFAGEDASPFIAIIAVNSGQSPALGFVWAPILEYLADVEPEITYDPGEEWLNQPGVDISPSSESTGMYVPIEISLVERVSKQREMPGHLGVSLTIEYAWTDVFGNMTYDVASFAGVVENYKGRKRPRLHELDTSDWGCLKLWPIEKGKKWAGIAVKAPDERKKEEKDNAGA